jgi:hypothetical protein
MHPQLTQALGTAQQEEFVRSATAHRHRTGGQARSRSHHFLGARMGRYFRRGSQADQQSVCGAELGA